MQICPCQWSICTFFCLIRSCYMYFFVEDSRLLYITTDKNLLVFFLTFQILYDIYNLIYLLHLLVNNSIKQYLENYWIILLNKEYSLESSWSFLKNTCTWTLNSWFSGVGVGIWIVLKFYMRFRFCYSWRLLILSTLFWGLIGSENPIK